MTVFEGCSGRSKGAGRTYVLVYVLVLYIGSAQIQR